MWYMGINSSFYGPLCLSRDNYELPGNCTPFSPIHPPATAWAYRLEWSLNPSKIQNLHLQDTRNNIIYSVI